MLVERIDSREATQCQLANELDKNYEDLQGAQKVEQAMLMPFWKAKSALHAQAVEVKLEMQPLRDVSMGNILGTRIK